MCLWYIYLFQMKPFHLFNLIWSENCSFSSSCCCCYVLYILIFLPVFVFWSILDTSNTRKTKTNKTLTKSIWESIILLLFFRNFQNKIHSFVIRREKNKRIVRGWKTSELSGCYFHTIILSGNNKTKQINWWTDMSQRNLRQEK